jgi:hypothetical protein
MARSWRVARWVALVVALTLVVTGFVGTAGVAAKAAALSACPVTIPNRPGPPGHPLSRGFHGNGALWVGLPENGKVVAFRRGKGGLASKQTQGAFIADIRPDGSIEEKFPWWGATQVRGDLRITGRRLDLHAPPLGVDGKPGSGQPGFWASGVIFPTYGCWKVTGAVGNATPLAFVVKVVRG